MARKSSSGGGDVGSSSAAKRSRSHGGGGRGGSALREEVQVSKSPAEFFAENQSIAGFDNMGRALYTTIRELVENALDACESVGTLPDVKVVVEEMTQRMFNESRGVSTGGMVDGEVDKKEAEKKETGDIAGVVAIDDEEGGGNGATSAKKPKKKGGSSSSSSSSPPEAYFRITVRDNGCGMAHSAVPDLLGRVLSGSKYGVRQTRGKFGLGAKMALIWSKKSAGVPIRVTTSHMRLGAKYKEGDDGAPAPGEYVTRCVLDIDIYKNSPRVIEHTKSLNKDGWIGTEFEVTIAGNWTTYKSRIVQYLQQLAIITPYARLEMEYKNLADSRKDLGICYERRSEQMPEPATEVKHHPGSVNNLIVQQLLERTNAKTFQKFLCTELAGVSPAVASRIIDRLHDDGVETSTAPEDIKDRQVTRLVQLLRAESSDDGSDEKLGIKPPDGSCLSPLGEYNLNLGIQKVIEPDIIATARDKASSYDGHPFIVEAAVSLGGLDAREGISIVRFANRIPLLFEAGADVSTRVAQSKINWSLYKIDHKRDRIGVFVSIVSTKVPFKGTGKEYIGDDIDAIQKSVKRTLQMCCQQLRLHLTKRFALRDRRERRSRLARHVPDVGRALFGVLEQMRKRRLDEEAGSKEEQPSPRKLAMTAGTDGAKKRADAEEAVEGILLRLGDDGDITEEAIQKHLIEAIELQVDEDGLGGDGDGNEVQGKSGKKIGRKGKSQKRHGLEEAAGPMFLMPLWNLSDDASNGKNDIHHPLFTFRPLKHSMSQQ